MNGANVVGDFQNLLPQLRWLWWEHCPLDFAVVNFHPKKLVVLDLSWSMFSDDWGGWALLKVRCREGIPLVNNHVVEGPIAPSCHIFDLESFNILPKIKDSFNLNGLCLPSDLLPK